MFYIQYAYARIAGILERAAPQRGMRAEPAADASLLLHSAERALIIEMLRLRSVLRLCMQCLDVHHLAQYGVDLAAKFHAFYRDCPVVDAEPRELAQTRMKLVQAAQIALARVLGLMGMNSPHTM